MRLTKEAIEEFKKIYHEEFKEEIANDKAQELAENLISLFKIIYRSIPESAQGKTRNKNDPDSI